VLATNAIEPNELATFHHSFMLSNYEWTMKGNVPEDDAKDKEDPEDEVDERTKRKVN